MASFWIWLLLKHDRLYWVYPKLWSRRLNDFIMRRI